MRDKRAKQVFCRSEYQWESGSHKERVNEGEYGRCIFYSDTKIEE
jgi:hypothetical protein